MLERRSVEAWRSARHRTFRRAAWGGGGGGGNRCAGIAHGRYAVRRVRGAPPAPPHRHGGRAGVEGRQRRAADRGRLLAQGS